VAWTAAAERIDVGGALGCGAGDKRVVLGVDDQGRHGERFQRVVVVQAQVGDESVEGDAFGLERDRENLSIRSATSRAVPEGDICQRRHDNPCQALISKAIITPGLATGTDAGACGTARAR
jgi:hypothetical protein